MPNKENMHAHAFPGAECTHAGLTKKEYAAIQIMGHLCHDIDRYTEDVWIKKANLARRLAEKLIQELEP